VLASVATYLRRNCGTRQARYAMAFSAGLQLTGLDDFITPSQACIKPVQTPAGTCGRICGLGAAAKVPIHTPYWPWGQMVLGAVVIWVLIVEEKVIMLACACMV